MINMFLTVMIAATLFSTTAAANNDALNIDIQYRYRSKGTNEFKTLSDGQALYSGDFYKIVFTPTETTYVYIFQKGSSGNLYRLFPMKSFHSVSVNQSNPAQAGTTYYIPAADKSFFLDEQIGEETLYFIAARSADRLLEQQYDQVLIARQHSRSAAVTAAPESLEQNLRMRDPTGIAFDTAVTDEMDDIWQRFEICEGCVNILRFRHR
jgi:hypothetical protein